MRCTCCRGCGVNRRLCVQVVTIYFIKSICCYTNTSRDIEQCVTKNIVIGVVKPRHIESLTAHNIHINTVDIVSRCVDWSILKTPSIHTICRLSPIHISGRKRCKHGTSTIGHIHIIICCIKSYSYIGKPFFSVSHHLFFYCPRTARVYGSPNLIIQTKCGTTCNVCKVNIARCGMYGHCHADVVRGVIWRVCIKSSCRDIPRTRAIIPNLTSHIFKNNITVNGENISSRKWRE